MNPGICIGPHCFEDDELVLRTHYEEEARFKRSKRSCLYQSNSESSIIQSKSEILSSVDDPVATVSTGSEYATEKINDQNDLLSGLKQRLMAYILRDAQARDRKNERKEAVRSFFSHFDLLAKLYFTRAQFLTKRIDFQIQL